MVAEAAQLHTLGQKAAEDTPEHRKLVVEALRDLAAERGSVSAEDQRADPGLAAYVVDQAQAAVRAANAVEAGSPEPFYRGSWKSPTTGQLKTLFGCLWCGNGTVSERLAWIHSMKCRYRPRSGQSAAARKSRGGIS